MKRLLSFVLFWFVALGVSAQYFQFSQYNFTSLRTNPASPATSDYASLGLIYRNQGTASDVRMYSNLVSAIYPLIHKESGRRWSGVGMTLMDDRSGDLFKIQEASLSYAANVHLDKFQSIQLGLKGLYQRRSLNIDGLFTEKQYVADRGFDETLENGEMTGRLDTDFFSLSTGGSWQYIDENGIRAGYLGLALFDFNNPSENFLEAGQRLPETWVAQLSFRAFRESNLSFFPEALVTRRAANNVYNIGMVTRCDVKGTRTSLPFHVDVITKYVVSRSAIFGLQFHNERFSLGMSYDILVKKENVSNIGALEIGLELRQLVNPNPKRIPPKTVTRNARATKTPPSRPVSSPNQERSEQVKSEQPLVQTWHKKRDSIMAVNPSSANTSFIELEKVVLHFNFQSNSSELDPESLKFIDDLIESMAADRKISVWLTGHTDNIGSAPFNMRLSLARAAGVRDYLIKNGVGSERITVEGKGMSEPLNNNRTEAERAVNRRVEVRVLYANK